MEVSLHSPQTLKIKGKQVTLIVDPVASKAKFQGDGTVLLTGSMQDEKFVEGSRIALFGAGEYEVGGVKITGIKNADALMYIVHMDGINVLLTNSQALKGKDLAQAIDIIILLATDTVDAAIFASLTPHTVIVYGPKAKEEVAILGKEVTATTKYTVTKDKLPQEMEVVTLA